MHYYQHNIGDYARDTGHLSVIEHGVYRLLLDWCYLNEKPITTEQAHRVGRGNPEATQSVLSEFFSQTPDGWRHKRVDEEVAKYHDMAEKNRRNGSNGGRKKPKQNPVGSQVVSETNPDGGPNQEPRTNNQEPEEKGEGADAPPTRKQAIQKPDDVTDQVWGDWLALRKAKKAVVSETVLAGARREAEKADLTLGEFLSIWCLRGSQGLQADWIKPNERPSRYQPESFRDADERKRRQQWEEMTGRKWPGEDRHNVIDITPAQQRISQ